MIKIIDFGGVTMGKNTDLGNEWKNTVYDLGGAFVGLGKVMLHSVKKGVDLAYDYMNEKEKKSATDTKATKVTDVEIIDED